MRKLIHIFKEEFIYGKNSKSKGFTKKEDNDEELLGEFYESDAIFGKYEYSENNYVDVHSAANALRVAAKRGKFPIKIHQRGNEVYLEKVRV